MTDNLDHVIYYRSLDSRWYMRRGGGYTLDVSEAATFPSASDAREAVRANSDFTHWGLKADQKAVSQ